MSKMVRHEPEDEIGEPGADGEHHPHQGPEVSLGGELGYVINVGEHDDDLGEEVCLDRR